MKLYLSAAIEAFSSLLYRASWIPQQLIDCFLFLSKFTEVYLYDLAQMILSLNTHIVDDLSYSLLSDDILLF